MKSQLVNWKPENSWSFTEFNKTEMMEIYWSASMHINEESLKTVILDFFKSSSKI